jgi:putative hydrolase of the HAD superfamily
MTAAKSPARAVGAPRDFSPFDGVNAWVFDLDNTLYPREANLFMQIDQRIQDYLQRLFSMTAEGAKDLRKDYYERYGTTLRGLIVEHGITPDDFLEYVHDIDRSPLTPNPELARTIASLPGRKFILTNGSRRHAEKVAERLGFTDEFEDIFDIVHSELMPKPDRTAYDRFIAATGVAPVDAAMFEDLSRNLVVPKALGMRTVLVVPAGTREVVQDAWEFEGREDDHIDYVTANLGKFLADLLAATGKKAG